jgi:hypothetical protein
MKALNDRMNVNDLKRPKEKVVIDVFGSLILEVRCGNWWC